MVVDFKINKDEYGYFVIAYRIVRGVELQFPTCSSLSRLLNLPIEDLKLFLHQEYNGDEQTKNDIIHFDTFEKAAICVQGMRELVPKAIELHKLFLAQ